MRKKLKRSSLKLSDNDKRILSAYHEHKDPNIVTGWYFDWSCRDHPKQQQWLEARGFLEKYMATGARFGKSEGTAMDLMLETMASPGEIVCNTSITQDQSEIAWNTAVQWALGSRRFRHWVADVVYSPFPKLTLSHGGELWARSTQYKCKHLRGHKFKRINYDEIAYGNEEDEEVLKLRLADTGGTLSGTTTPKGKNWFYRNCFRPAMAEIRNAEAEKRRARCFVVTGTSYDNPHINHDYLDHVNLTERQRQQEIGGIFLDNDDAPFKEAHIKACTNADLNDELKLTTAAYEEGTLRRPPGRYIAAYDIAKKADWTVGLVFRVDVRPWRLVYYERFQREPWPVVEERMRRCNEIFGGQFGYDGTGVGDPVGDHLKIRLNRLEEFIFTPKFKTELIQNLVVCLEERKFVMPFIKQMQDELYGYEWDDKALVQDTVMSLAMAAWMMNDEKPAGGWV